MQWFDLSVDGLCTRLAPDLTGMPARRVDLRVLPWKRVEVTASTMARFDGKPGLTDYLANLP